MYTRALATLALVVLALGAAGFYLSRPQAKGSEAPPVVSKTLEGTPDGSKSVGSVQAPPEAGGAAPSRTSPGRESPAAEAPPLEPVVPLLELNIVVAGGSADSSVDSLTLSIDELLNGKHAGKTKTQLALSLRSVQAVIQSQRTPDNLAKDQILSPEALDALQIEAAWLKERVVN